MTIIPLPPPRFSNALWLPGLMAVLTCSSSGDSGSSSDDSAGLTIETRTSGEGLPVSPYTLRVDGKSPETIGINATVTFRVIPGDHTVSLEGIPANCAIPTGESQTVAPGDGDTLSVTFQISCQLGPSARIVGSQGSYAGTGARGR